MMHTLDLSGVWTLKQQGQSNTIPATVPGNVHTDLIDADRIPDPYVRDNERNLQWIGETAWEYSREFDVSPELLAQNTVLLRCEGLDTLATVRVNDKVVGTTDNMYRTWEFDLKPVLKQGVNTIAVRFAPTPPYIKKQEKRGHVDVSPVGFFTENLKRQWIRKEPCNFGWDWGPTLITCGIWRAIRIVAFDLARITDVHIRQKHGRNKVDLAIALATEKNGRRPLLARYTVRYKDKVVAQDDGTLTGTKGNTKLTIKQPHLWWPNGHGDQPLYDVDVELVEETGTVIDTTTRRIGLRVIRLDRHKDQWGESFQFTCNGRTFFAKGANWIPADSFATRVSAEDYRRLIGDAALANMNMIRVWGGGYYEDDLFYETCDELGICIWQDFMFACAHYPVFDADFVENASIEAEENIRKIRHHACLALWCGNNELEMVWVVNKGQNKEEAWDIYRAFFDTHLAKLVRKHDPDTDYWPCSPHTPVKKLREDFNHGDYGDAHLWDCWHGGAKFEWYRTTKTRFSSEFGFQSFPEPRTVEHYTNPDERNVTHPMMEYHQRSWIGNEAIVRQMLDWFRMPKDFDSTLWLSQILQGLGIKYGVEHWRRSMPQTMGTLYWQLNDCWPVASWASIDWFGRWKALHYMARRFFEPVLVSAIEDPDKALIELHLTNDGPQKAQATVDWTLTDLEGSVLDTGTVKTSVAPCRSKRATVVRMKKHVDTLGADNLILWFEARQGKTCLSKDIATLVRPKGLLLPEPNVKAEVVNSKDTTHVLRLTTDKPALWIWFELEGVEARYSDAFFAMRPGEPVEIEVTTDQPMTKKKLLNALTIRDLTQTY